MYSMLRIVALAAASATHGSMLGGDGISPPPVAFWYAGRPANLSSWRPWATNWSISRRDSGDGIERRRSGYDDPETGLRVMVSETRYADYPGAREWVLSFRQPGTSSSLRICNVSGLQVTLPPPAAAAGIGSSAGTGMIQRFRGSAAAATDFAPLVQPLPPGTATAFGPFYGRSSAHTLPLFAVAAGQGGIVASIGWSGSWQVDISRAGGPETSLNIWHGAGNNAGAHDGSGTPPSIPKGSAADHDTSFCAQLQPGESVRLMRVLAIEFEGSDVQVGFNTHRQLVMQHKLPRHPRTGELLGALVASDADGRTFPELMPPAAAKQERNTTWSCPSCSSRQIHVHLPGLVAIGAEALWLDAYWFEGAFPAGVGNWSDPPELAIDRCRWPEGLRPLSDAVADSGLEFILWFEPERIAPGTWLRRNFPEWSLPHGGPGETLLNLGIPGAVEYISSYVSEAIQDFGLSVFRTDYNIDPLALWLGPPYADDATRRGMNEAHYIEGLYRFWDLVRAQNDGILIDNCASGGRRIDLETLSRSAPLWRTDYDAVGGCCSFAWKHTCIGVCPECSGPFGCGVMDNSAAQSMSMGLSVLTPIHSGPVPSWDEYYWRSTGVIGKTIYWGRAGFEHLLANATALEQAQQAVAETKSLRPVVLHPRSLYWPLDWGGLPHTYDDGTIEIQPHGATWAAYQFHSPHGLGGFAMVFRRDKCQRESYTLHMRGLTPTVQYSVRYCFTYTCGAPVVKSAEQMSNLTVHLASMGSSLLIRYKPVATAVPLKSDEPTVGATAAVDVVCANQTDCTSELQLALDNPQAAVVTLKFAAQRKWITRPLFLCRSNVAVVLEAGVVLQARRHFFHGTSDCLLTIQGAANISVEGPGELRMWREDYANPQMYSKAEWRTGLSISRARNVTVKHLLINNTGGDGVYLKGVEQTVLHRVTTQGAYRNGLSVISATDLLVDECNFLNTGHFSGTVSTGGTAPRAGVDLEPNHPSDSLRNVTLRRCVAAGNTDNAYDISVNFLTSHVEVLFEDCIARDCAGGWGSGFRLDSLLASQAGSITLSGCQVSNMSGAALTIEGPSAGNDGKPPAPSLIPVDVLVENMDVHSVASMWKTMYHGVALGFYPLTFGGQRMAIKNPIQFQNLTIHDSGKKADQAFAGCHGANPPQGLGGFHPVPCEPANLTDLRGSVTVVTAQPKVCSKANLGVAGKNLKVTCASTP